MLALRIVAVLMALTLASAPVLGQQKEHPIAAEVKSQLKDPNKPFTMMVLLKVKDGATDKFEAAFAKAVKPTRAEKGCLTYDLNREAKSPNQYVLYERWQNLPALQAHLDAKHITTLLAELGDLLASPPELRIFFPTGN